MSDSSKASSAWSRPLAALVAVLILAAMGWSLWTHGGPMFRAASGLDASAMAVALGMCLAYRVVNGFGWGLILGALGEPVKPVPAARVWLASEACRWLPGSLWSFGSRAVLASRRGLPGSTVAASLVMELAVTVLAWVAVALLGINSVKFPESLTQPIRSLSAPMVVSALGILAIVAIVGSRSAWVHHRLVRLLGAGKLLCAKRPNGGKLLGAFAFYVVMGMFNGATLLVIVRSSPGGLSCPPTAVVAANALAWLVGFFALFAPGGLVVREACLSAMLSPWMPAEQALAVALAWRMLQIVAEIACFAAVAAWGLPGSLSVGSQAIPSPHHSAVPDLVGSDC